TRPSAARTSRMRQHAPTRRCHRSSNLLSAPTSFPISLLSVFTSTLPPVVHEVNTRSCPLVSGGREAAAVRRPLSLLVGSAGRRPHLLRTLAVRLIGPRLAPRAVVRGVLARLGQIAARAGAVLAVRCRSIRRTLERCRQGCAELPVDGLLTDRLDPVAIRAATGARRALDLARSLLRPVPVPGGGVRRGIVRLRDVSVGTRALDTRRLIAVSVAGVVVAAARRLRADLQRHGER